MNLLIEEIRDWWRSFLSYVPGRAGSFLRRVYYRSVLAESGLTLSIGGRVELSGPESISLGNEVYIGHDCVLRACGGGSIKIGNGLTVNRNVYINADFGRIEIGSQVMIGPNVVIRASDHETRRHDIPIKYQGQTGGSIVIGDDVWIGANVVIVAGVEIGSHVVIGAGAVVTRAVPDYSFVAGVPARVIRDRRTSSAPSPPLP